ncbi:TPA: hypothetical protein JRW62_001633 [Elizabethkingia meningoseptica]|uniref:hypothetical protein n=1 Tax=Elizabethkingia meningoseptica TaxID=238 RepID=UPI0022F190A8|nr:hypothetical protein [Elizabethkingia meningoseptica]EJK5328955.1 hypothetical protein [Elizabethkingia meningoseptica]WBS75116.1 hypothetical protein PF438_01220 [Elizabethkingia meningoseptica]HAY3562637.1 hypothetical protein [Elizabethkingia meningoseptica]
MKNLFLVLFLCSSILYSQKKDYKLLSTDKYNNKWYYSFDKKTSDGFYSWLKMEETLQKNPSTESTEYFIEFKCSNQTMSDEIIIINWRGDKPETYNRKAPFKTISKDNIAYNLVKKYCI